MWIKQSLFEKLVGDAREALAKASVLEQRLVAQDTTMDWFRIRVTQLEKERAQMLYKYTGVVVETPNIVRVPETTPQQLFNEAMSFEDMGDEAAKAAGIGWDKEGRVTYAS